MKSLAMTAISLSMAASAVAQNEKSDNALQIARNGFQASAKGPADNFTGTVRVDPLFPFWSVSMRAWPCS